MAEDPIEKAKCIICGKDTDNTTCVTFSIVCIDNIPMCEECQTTTSFSETIDAIKKYHRDRRYDEDIGRIIALDMKKRGYEHYMGQDMQGSESRHFIKDGRIVTVIVNHYPDEELFEAIRGE